MKHLDYKTMIKMPHAPLIPGCEVHIYQPGELIMPGDIGWFLLTTKRVGDDRYICVIMPITIHSVNDKRIDAFIPAINAMYHVKYDDANTLAIPICRLVPTQGGVPHVR